MHIWQILLILSTLSGFCLSFYLGYIVGFIKGEDRLYKVLTEFLEAYKEEDNEGV